MEVYRNLSEISSRTVASEKIARLLILEYEIKSMKSDPNQVKRKIVKRREKKRFEKKKRKQQCGMFFSQTDAFLFITGCQESFETVEESAGDFC